MEAQEYLTVGDLAQRVGVTVRTIQYYDQQGLLSPSARGPQNQRLYTASDIANLHQIMTLKYLGLSLSDIRERLAAGVTADDVQRLVSGQMAEIEAGFEKLLRRMTVLRELADITREKVSVDWDQLVSSIEHQDAESGIFNQAASREEGEHLPPEGFGEWHNLVAQAIRLFSTGVAPEGPAAQALAERYAEMKARDGGKMAENFILLANTVHGEDGSFGRLRASVFAFLDAAVAARKEHGDSQASSPR